MGGGVPAYLAKLAELPPRRLRARAYEGGGVPAYVAKWGSQGAEGEVEGAEGRFHLVFVWARASV